MTGQRGAVARLHPAIKGVWGAQSSGASIVSFNSRPSPPTATSRATTRPSPKPPPFAYSTALNHFLERDSGHRIQIGDASTVFWAEAAEPVDAEAAEVGFGALMRHRRAGPCAGRSRRCCEKLRAGRPIAEVEAGPAEGCPLPRAGLAPNAARLSIRFYVEDDFGVIAERYLAHLERLRVEPPPKEEAPSMWRLLVETAVLRKSENVPPKLAGDWMRAILTGAPYPRSCSPPS